MFSRECLFQLRYTNINIQTLEESRSNKMKANYEYVIVVDLMESTSSGASFDLTLCIIVHHPSSFVSLSLRNRSNYRVTRIHQYSSIPETHHPLCHRLHCTALEDNYRCNAARDIKTLVNVCTRNEERKRTLEGEKRKSARQIGGNENNRKMRLSAESLHPLSTQITLRQFLLFLKLPTLMFNACRARVF